MDLENARIVGLIVDNGTIIHTIKIIEFNNIYCIKQDAVVAKFKKNIKKLKDFDSKKSLIKNNYHIIDKEVVEENGNLLGFVQDILFQKDGGNILGLVLTNGIIDDILRGVQILPVNSSMRLTDERLVVSSKVKNSILDNIGGLKNLLELK